jgi:GST-like protein
MIDLYTWATPNGRKVSILLEELGVDYTVFPVNIGAGEQHKPAFLENSPNNKIPAIVDHENGMRLMESGAILIYLSDKYKQFFANDLLERSRITEWVMWQMGGLGPMLGQVHHFTHFNPGKSTYAEERFQAEAARLYKVLDSRLSGQKFICNTYSIADIACWPWVSRYDWQQTDLRNFPNVRGWYQRILERDAVQRGYHIPENMGSIPAG